MLSEPLVTIGIPFLNPGLLLLDAVRSVFAQTYTNWELILVDDGSRDGSVELARKIRDPRVRLISDGKNTGLVSRLNQIIEITNGEYIARMDADDIMHPKRIETQVSFLETNRSINVVDTGAIILNHLREPVGIRGLKSKDLPGAVEALKRGIVLHPSVMARTAWYLQHRYDTAYPRAEDRELFVRTLEEGGLAHISQPLHFYFYEGNVRLKAFLESYRSERKVITRYGPSLVGFPQTIWLYMRSLIKSAALVGLVILGKEEGVTRRAYEPIPKSLADEAREVLRQIRQQVVSGWEWGPV